jgi:hypothetical protein
MIILIKVEYSLPGNLAISHALLSSHLPTMPPAMPVLLLVRTIF